MLMILKRLVAEVKGEWRKSPTGRKEEWHFEVREGEWVGKGFTSKLDETGEFEIGTENELVTKCVEILMKVLSKPNKFEKRLARMDDISIDNPATRSQYYNIIFTDSKDDFCWGVGGVGGGKIFWTPYTIKNPEVRDRIINADLGCDNCRVLAHETWHGIGSHTEFDKLSELIGIYFRFENLPEEEWGFDVRWKITNWALGAEAIAHGKKSRFERKKRNAFCAVYTRYPEKVIKILREDRFSEERISKIISVCR